jgi:hypothetical protein
MISGSYIEFFCPKCLYFPQEKCKDDDDIPRTKNVILCKIKDHQKKIKHIPKEIYKKIISEK